MKKRKLKPLTEQVVVLCGASSGIGKETAHLLTRRGARVVVAARDQGALESLVEEIRQHGGEGIAVKTEAADFGSMQALAAQAVRHYGRIDTWVQLAGISLYATLEDTTPEELKRITEVNFFGHFYAAKAALPYLKREGRGALIHVSSVEGKRAFPYQSVYAASKHAVIGLIDALRLELKKEGWPIAVTNIMPSGINTPLFDHARTKLGVAPRPIPPVYQPQVVAELIAYAAENPSRELVAGGGGQILIALQHLFPRLVDQLVLKAGFKAQKTKNKKSAEGSHNLWEPTHPHESDRIKGHFNQESVPRSFYNWIETHPTFRRIALLGLASAFFWRKAISRL